MPIHHDEQLLKHYETLQENAQNAAKQLDSARENSRGNGLGILGSAFSAAANWRRPGAGLVGFLSTSFKALMTADVEPGAYLKNQAAVKSLTDFEKRHESFVKTIKEMPFNPHASNTSAAGASNSNTSGSTGPQTQQRPSGGGLGPSINIAAGPA